MNKVPLREVLPLGDFSEQIDICEKLGTLQSGVFIAGGFASKILEYHLTKKPLAQRQPVDIGWELLRAMNSFGITKDINRVVSLEEQHFQNGLKIVLAWAKQPRITDWVYRNFNIGFSAMGPINKRLRDKISLLGLFEETLGSSAFNANPTLKRAFDERNEHGAVQFLRLVRLLDKIAAGAGDDSPFLAKAIYLAGNTQSGMRPDEHDELANDPYSLFERIMGRITYGVIPHGDLIHNKDFMAVVAQPSNRFHDSRMTGLIHLPGKHIPPLSLKTSQTKLISEGLVKGTKRFPDVDIFFETPLAFKRLEEQISPFICGEEVLDKRVEVRLSPVASARQLLKGEETMITRLLTAAPSSWLFEAMKSGKISEIAEPLDTGMYGSDRSPALSLFLVDDSGLEPFEVQIVDWSANTGLKAEEQIEHFDNERSKVFIRREQDGELWLFWTDGAEKDIRENITTFTAIASGPYTPIVAKRLGKFPNIIIPQRTRDVFVETTKATLFSKFVSELAAAPVKESVFLAEIKRDVECAQKKNLASVSLQDDLDKTDAKFLQENSLLLSWLARKPNEHAISGRFTKVLDSFFSAPTFDYANLVHTLVPAVETKEGREIFAHTIATTILWSRASSGGFIPRNETALDFFLSTHAEGSLLLPFCFGFGFDELDDPELANPCAKAAAEGLQVYRAIITSTTEGINLNSEIALRFRGTRNEEKFFWRPMTDDELDRFDSAMNTFFEAIDYDNMVKAILDELNRDIGQENLAAVTSGIQKIRAFQRENVRKILKLQ